MSFWLVRKADFRILRPMSEEDLVKQIEGGKLSPQDEVCSEKGYWFPLQDLHEVRDHLGDIKIEAIFPKNRKEITTETETDTQLVQRPSSSKKLSKEAKAAAKKAKRSKGSGSAPARPVELEVTQTESIGLEASVPLPDRTDEIPAPGPLPTSTFEPETHPGHEQKRAETKAAPPSVSTSPSALRAVLDRKIISAEEAIQAQRIHRIKNVSLAFLFFGIFIGILIWLWSGTY